MDLSTKSMNGNLGFYVFEKDTSKNLREKNLMTGKFPAIF